MTTASTFLDLALLRLGQAKGTLPSDSTRAERLGRVIREVEEIHRDLRSYVGQPVGTDRDGPALTALAEMTEER